MQCSERRKWHFLASNFKNFPRGHAPGRPSYVRSLKMLRSDFWLDPPLPGTMASKRAKVDFISEIIFKEINELRELNNKTKSLKNNWN
jgi:hypothetical protein